MMKEWVLLFLSGKRISEAKDYLKLQFGKVYSTLVGDNPSSYLDLTLGELNSINVNFCWQCGVSWGLPPSSILIFN